MYLRQLGTLSDNAHCLGLLSKSNDKCQKVTYLRAIDGTCRNKNKSFIDKESAYILCQQYFQVTTHDTVDTIFTDFLNCFMTCIRRTSIKMIGNKMATAQ